MAESLARRLVEPGCSGQNALVGLSQHVTRDQARRQEMGVAVAAVGMQHHAGLQAAVLAPQTFNMHALLTEALAFSSASAVSPAGAAASAVASSASAGVHGAVSASAPALSALAASALPPSHAFGPSMMFVRGAPFVPMLTAPPFQPQGAADERPSWGANFLASRDHLLLEPAGTSTAAAAAEFMDMDTDYHPEDRLTGALERLRNGTYTETDAEKDRFWEDLSRTWSQYLDDETTAGGETALGAGLTSASVSPATREFVFQANNPHTVEADPLGAGLEAMRQGRVPEAVLLFEAAASRDPENAAAWRHLGVSLAEAEREADAIAACQRCLALAPADRVALISLARSFTNELRNSEAVHALIGWLAANPAYADLVAADQCTSSEGASAAAGPAIGGFASYAEFSRCERLLLAAAARQTTGQPDPELQLALGVLYNLHGDFQRAVDSFKAALQVQPDDYLTWNKLGATLANSGRHEDAVRAYRRALSLAPGFVRARANLGIACHSLRAYDQALANYAAALRLLQPARLADSAVWGLARQTAARMAYEQPQADAAAGYAERVSAVKALIEARDLAGLCRAVGVPPATEV